MKDQKTPEEIKTKTLLDCKNEYAKSRQFRDWNELMTNLAYTTRMLGPKRLIEEMNEAAELYAQTISEGKDREIEKMKGMLQSCVHQSERLGFLQNDLIEEINETLNKVH